MTMGKSSSTVPPAPMQAVMPRVCIDEDCPNCGWPERWADVFEDYAVYGCNKCDHKSLDRKS